MTKNSRLGIIAIALVALIALGVIAVKRWSGSSPSNANAVRVATNLPLTGELASYGKAVQRGATMALEDLKQSDPSGPSIAFDWQDNAGSPQTAVSIMQQQYLQPPDIYVSGVKPQFAAIAEQVSARGTPHFVWVFDAVINAKTRNHLRTWVSFKIEPSIFLSYAESRKAKRVAIAYVQLPNTQEEYQQYVIPGLKQRGLEDKDIFVEVYNIGTKDFKNIALKMRDFKPDLIILNGFQNDLVGLVRALRPLSLITDGNTIAAYDMLDAAELLGADETEGIRVVAPLFVTRPDRLEVAAWRSRFTTKYGRQPLYSDAFAYDMTMIIHDAAKRLKLPATSAQWLEALRSTNIAGVTGPLRFDGDGDLDTPLEVGVYRNGKLVPLSQ